LELLLLLLLAAAAAATQRSLLHGEEGEEGGKGSFGTGDKIASAGMTGVVEDFGCVRLCA
jgi:hypothetical protein